MPTATPTAAPTEVDPATVNDWMSDADAVTVLDVRSPAEFETAHITGSYNPPLDLVGEHATQLAARLDRRVVLVCQSGVRARQAQQRLAGTGMDNLHVLKTGVPGYADAGGQVVQGRPPLGARAPGPPRCRRTRPRRSRSQPLGAESRPARRRRRHRTDRLGPHRHLHHGQAALCVAPQPRNQGRRPAAARPAPHR